MKWMNDLNISAAIFKAVAVKSMILELEVTRKREVILWY